MRNRITLCAVAATVLVLGILVSGGVKAMAKTAGSAPASASQSAPAKRTTADDPRNAQIKALGDRIRELREQFQAQTAPLEAQIKSLREKFEADLAPLEAQRKALVAEGESSGLKSLMDEESAQLATLAAREKEEIEKVRERYAAERKTIQESFQRRRHELETEKK